jgi:hypothetical protein
MTNLALLQITGAVVRSGFSTLEKSASASPQQQELLAAGWPREDEQLTKVATLARMLGTGLMIEEAEASIAQAV